MAILVTGGTGYIGSHTVVELIEKGKDVVIVDNLVNSSIDVIDYIKQITGKTVKFYNLDIRNEEALDKVFKENKITEVIHFAGLKAVPESVKKPLEYYDNNLTGTLVLLKVMRENDCKKIVFSSSATVYGNNGEIKYVETMERGKTTNPYGTTKSMIENILEDLYKSDNTWGIVILRYFNPIGAHSSGLIGDNPNGIPNNLMPYIQRVASGKLAELSVYGNDYETKDGTGVRDYIHVVDLAKGHLKAIEKLEKEENGLNIYNLGSGKGCSVLEIINTFESVNAIKVPYKIVERRAGDLPEYFADAQKAKKELNWETEKTLEDMCRDAWNFAKNH
ncbi:MAG: UDP-glucose 4-epimerase GalE [Clostridia bacterium]|nr:UDP-glucose 4-epimerase GalE [Clostridia bacterium]